MKKKSKDYIEGIVSGNRRALAKTITIIESNLLVHRKLSHEIIESLIPGLGKAVRVGITGVPGVGKSTFIESFGFILAEKGYNIAVLAVDPSSNISGGSIMADKTRMEKLAVHPNAFIRPSPSGGTLGGVTRMTRETIIVCEAAGFDVILVETVGVGQSETTVASMVDFFLVLMLSGAGDEIQGIKKGILEIADAVVVNKADGDNILKAEQARKAYENALHMLNPVTSTWVPPVLTCSSTTPFGLESVWEQIILHNQKLSNTGELTEKRRRQSVDWMWSLIENGLRDHFFKQAGVKTELYKITEAVKSEEMSPNAGAERLLSLL